MSDLPDPALLLWSDTYAWSVCQFISAAIMCGYQHEHDAVQAYKLHLRIGMHDQPMVTMWLCYVSPHTLHLLLYLSNGNVVHGLIVLEVKCLALRDLLLLLTYQIFFLHEAGMGLCRSKWPCPLLSMPVTTLHYTKVVLWLCCLDWVKPPHECINQKCSCQINLLLQLYCYSDQLIYMQYSDSMTCYSKVTCMQSLFCANVCWGQTCFNQMGTTTSYTLLSAIGEYDQTAPCFH